MPAEITVTLTRDEWSSVRQAIVQMSEKRSESTVTRAYWTGLIFTRIWPQVAPDWKER